MLETIRNAFRAKPLDDERPRIGARVGAYLRHHLPEHVPIALKLALVFSLLISSGMVTLGVLVGANQSRLLDQQMQRFGTTVAERVADSAKEPLLAGDNAGLGLIANQLLGDPTIAGTAIFSDEAAPLTLVGALPPEPLLADAGLGGTEAMRARRMEWTGTDEAGSPRELVGFVSPITYQDLTAGYALVSFDRDLLARARDDTLEMVTTTIVLMLLLGIAASLFLGRRLTQPIQDLMAASKAYSEGDFEFRCNDRRKDELGILMQSLNNMGEGLLRKRQVEQVFSRYVSPQVATRILDDLQKMERVTLGGRHVVASVIFADIVGFTSLSESLPPQEVSELLNEYFTLIDQAVHACDGHVDKYMGDCAMCVFGVPEESADHAANALACAWMIVQLVESLNQRRELQGKTPVEFRVGVNSGPMLAGNMGSHDRMDYTVVGDAVNLASRLSHVGDPGEIIVTEEMLQIDGLAERFITEPHGTIQLRGKRLPVATYRLTGVADEFRFKVLSQTRRILKDSRAA